MEMKPIEIVKKINEDCFDYFSNIILDKKDVTQKINGMMNILIQSKMDKNAIDFKDTMIKYFQDDRLIVEFSKILDCLNSNYDIEDMWFMCYYPKSHLKGFHNDGEYKRYGIAFNENPKFYSYECNLHKNKNINEDILSKKFLENLDDIEKFNEYFLTQDECYIHNFKKNTIYSFGKTHHSFYNNSNEMRWNLIFDIKD